MHPNLSSLDDLKASLVKGRTRVPQFPDRKVQEPLILYSFSSLKAGEWKDGKRRKAHKRSE